MVATVGSISIDLSTNAAKFAQGFKASATTVEQQSARMSKAVTGFSRASQAASGVLSGFVGGIVAGGALAALGSLTGALSKARTALSEFDDVLNNSRASGLSAETYQALAFGAAQSDVEQEKLNKSLEIFAKNIGLAQEGTGSLFSSLKTLNPELLQAVLTAGDQEERLKLVADAMNQASDATQRAALAQAAFGKGGIDLIRILDSGAAGIEAFKEEAKALGLIVTESDLNRWSEADKQLDTLARVIDGNLSQALAKLAPLLVAGAEATVTIAQNVNDLSTAINNFANNGSVQNFLALLAALGIEPKITGGLLGAIKDGVVRDVPIITKEIADVEAEIKHLQDTGEGGAGIVIDQDIKRLEQLKAELKDVQSTAAALNSGAGAAVSNMLKGLDKLGGGQAQPSGALPTVHGSNLGRNNDGPIQSTVNGVGVTSFGGSRDAQEFIRSIEDNKRATEDGFDDATDATDSVRESADRISDGVGRMDGNLGGHFDGLGTRIDDGLAGLGKAISSALSYQVPANSGYATGDAANSFAFSGKNGTGTSWAGRRLTFGGGGNYGDAGTGGSKLDDYSSMSKLNYRMPDTSSISEGGDSSGANINVSVVVKPVLEGQRLSSQSSAEIKQAAAAGTNAALRAYNGR